MEAIIANGKRTAGVLAALITALAIPASIALVVIIIGTQRGDGGLPQSIDGPVVRSAPLASIPASYLRIHDSADPTTTPVPTAEVVEAVTPTPAPPTEAPAITVAPVPVSEPVGIDSPPVITYAPPPPPPPPPAPTPVPGRYRPDISDALYGLFNQVRADAGIAPVSANSTLIASADGYSLLHFVYNDPYSLSHNLDGSPGDRAWRRGYCCAVGEILATAQGSAQTFADLWMGSAPHRAIILDPQYVSVGISCYSGPYTSPNGSQSEPVLCVADWGSG